MKWLLMRMLKWNREQAPKAAMRHLHRPNLRCHKQFTKQARIVPERIADKSSSKNFAGRIAFVNGRMIRL